MTGQGLIDGAAQDLTVLALGETLNTDEYAAALIKLNELLGSWNSQRLMAPWLQEYSFAMAANSVSDTIGPTSAHNAVPRVVSIDSARYEVTGVNTMQSPLSPMSVKQFAAKLDVGTKGTPLEYLYIPAMPNAIIQLWPIPAAAGNFRFWAWQQFPTNLALVTNIDLTFAPGAERAIRLNLAIDLAPMFGKQVTNELAANAANALTAIRSVNAPPMPGAAAEAQASGSAQPAPPDASNSLQR